MKVQKKLKNITFPGKFFKDGKERKEDCFFCCIITIDGEGTIDTEHRLSTPSIREDFAEGINDTDLIQYLQSFEALQVYSFTAEVFAIIIANGAKDFKILSIETIVIANAMANGVTHFPELALFKSESELLTMTTISTTMEFYKENKLDEFLNRYFGAIAEIFLLINGGATREDLALAVNETA